MICPSFARSLINLLGLSVGNAHELHTWLTWSCRKSLRPSLQLCPRWRAQSACSIVFLLKFLVARRVPPLEPRLVSLGDFLFGIFSLYFVLAHVVELLPIFFLLHSDGLQYLVSHVIVLCSPFTLVPLFTCQFSVLFIRLQ